MGSILIVLGLVLYFARGVEAVLALVAVGIVLLIAGVLWKPRKKKTGNTSTVAKGKCSEDFLRLHANIVDCPLASVLHRILEGGGKTHTIARK